MGERERKQIERMASLLRDVQRSGGRDRWDYLKSHGHSYSTLRSALKRRWLCEMVDDRYEITTFTPDFFVWYDLWKKRTASSQK